MNVNIKNLSISGIATVLPSNKLDLNSLCSEYGENEVRRIIATTGISSVRIANRGVNTSDLCMTAAQNLLDKINVPAKTIDAIVFISQTPDALMPATSTMLQHKLGVSTNAVAFDINYGCSGYIYGLYQAAMLISSGGCNNVLLCAGDIITPLLHPEDKHVRMLFGDAGSATLIERGKDSFSFSIKTDGSGMMNLKAEKIPVNCLVEKNKLTNNSKFGYLYMNGAAIMEFALKEVPIIVYELLNTKKWQAHEVGTYVLHQANFFMLNYLRKKMRLAKEAVPIAVENNGNTGPASIPLTLSLTKDRLKKEGRLGKVVMCGFGVGLSLGAVGLDLSNAIILPPSDYIN